MQNLYIVMIHTKLNNNFAKCYLQNMSIYNCTYIYTKEVATKVIAIILVFFKEVHSITIEMLY